MTRRNDPFEEIEELFERMSRGFGDVAGEVQADLGGGGIHIDMADTGEAVVVTADVPGFEKDDIDVTVEDGRLTIAAETAERSETEDDDRRYYHRERSRKSARRTVRLPVEVNEHEASATYENGVLTVELPKLDAGDDEGHSIDIN